jgi:L-threonylcarbamoyladenylate synthase
VTAPGRVVLVTRTLSVASPVAAGKAFATAARTLRHGGLVAFPTESFYGLGAHALRVEAVARVFGVKGRPEHKPLLVLVDSVESAEALCADVPPGARDLMARHWPGPLTLVLPAAAGLPDALTAGTGTIGLRAPGHPVALGLVRAAGIPITAPSANPSGEPPPTSAAAVRAYFEGKIDVILDGGRTAGGAGSTIADCTVWPPRVLRQGPVVLS